MNEATLKSSLVGVLKNTMPGAVVVRHEDKFKAGVPDISVTWRGTTSWVEVKYERKRRSPLTALQAKFITDLARTGAPAYALTYRELPGGLKETLLVRYITDGSTAPPIAFGVRKWAHADAATTLRVLHEDRAELLFRQRFE